MKRRNWLRTDWRELDARVIGRPARDVAPGESWAFRDHRTLAEIARTDTTPKDAGRHS